MKAIAATARAHRPEGQTDRADMMRLLENFPHLRDSADVPTRLRERNAGEAAQALWDAIKEIGRPTAPLPRGPRGRRQAQLSTGRPLLSHESAPALRSRNALVDTTPEDPQ